MTLAKDPGLFQTHVFLEWDTNVFTAAISSPYPKNRIIGAGAVSDPSLNRVKL